MAIDSFKKKLLADLEPSMRFIPKRAPEKEVKLLRDRLLDTLAEALYDKAPPERANVIRIFSETMSEAEEHPRLAPQLDEVISMQFLIDAEERLLDMEQKASA